VSKRVPGGILAESFDISQKLQKVDILLLARRQEKSALFAPSSWKAQPRKTPVFPVKVKTSRIDPFEMISQQLRLRFRTPARTRFES